MSGWWSRNRQLIFQSMGTLLAIALFIYLAIPKDWQDATRTHEDGSVSLSEEWEKTITEKQEQYAEHELYMLAAASSGYFLCKHCPTGKFFLEKGEVYRYGGLATLACLLIYLVVGTPWILLVL